MNNKEAPEEVSEPLPHPGGGLSRTVLGIVLVSGLLVVSIIVAWLAGWIGGKSHGSAVAKTARPLPVAELKLDLAKPTDWSAVPEDLSLKDALAAVAAGADAKANPLDDDSRFLSKLGGWGDPREAGEKEGARRNWELHFIKGITREKYSRQLDFFGIELAVVMPDNKLVYVRNFSKAKPETHTGPADQEKRFYLAWRTGDLSRADFDLLDRASISTGNRVVLKILPAEVETTLAKLEKDHAGDESGNLIKTQFGIRAAGDGYEFYVAEQYRKERDKK